MLKRIISYLSLILESAKKERKLIFKDGAVVEIYIVFVVLVYFFYTFVYSPEIFRKLPIAFVDNDQTTVTQQIRRMLNDTESLDLNYDATSLEEAKRLFEQEKVSGIILIPKDFSAKLQKSGGNPSIAVYSDASYMLYYDKTLQAVTNSLATFTGELQLQQTMMSGVPMKEAVASSKPFNIIANPLYNLEEGYAIFIIPMVLIVALQTLQLTGMGVLYGTMRETNTFITNFAMARRRFGYIFLTIGRSLPYLLISSLLLLLGIKVVFHIFTIPQRGDLMEVMVFLIPVILAITFLGMVLMNIFRNREDTIMLCTVFSIPTLMMGGVSYPIVAFPLWIKVLGFFFPSTIGVKGFLALTQAGASLNEIKDIYIQMWGLCLFYFILALWTNRRFLYKENPITLALPEGETTLLLAEHNDPDADTTIPAIASATAAQDNTTVTTIVSENMVTEDTNMGNQNTDGKPPQIENSNTTGRPIGDSDASTLSLLAPLADFVQGYHKLENLLETELSEKTKHIAKENLQAPPAYLAVPALRALRYTTDTTELKNLYLNLLAIAMDQDTAAAIHPNFIDTIKQLTPDEVRLLAVFNEVDYVPYINIIQITDQEAGIYQTVLENHVHVVEDANILISFIGNLSLYFDNLIRLGILASPKEASLEVDAYSQLESCCLTRNIKKEIESKECSYAIQRRYFKTTAYGRGFINAIIKNNND